MAERQGESPAASGTNEETPTPAAVYKASLGARSAVPDPYPEIPWEQVPRTLDELSDDGSDDVIILASGSQWSGSTVSRVPVGDLEEGDENGSEAPTIIEPETIEMVVGSEDVALTDEPMMGEDAFTFLPPEKRRADETLSEVGPGGSEGPPATPVDEKDQPGFIARIMEARRKRVEEWRAAQEGGRVSAMDVNTGRAAPTTSATNFRQAQEEVQRRIAARAQETPPDPPAVAPAAPEKLLSGPPQANGQPGLMWTVCGSHPRVIATATVTGDAYPPPRGRGRGRGRQQQLKNLPPRPGTDGELGATAESTPDFPEGAKGPETRETFPVLPSGTTRATEKPEPPYARAPEAEEWPFRVIRVTEHLVLGRSLRPDSQLLALVERGSLERFHFSPIFSGHPEDFRRLFRLRDTFMVREGVELSPVLVLVRHVWKVGTETGSELLCTGVVELDRDMRRVYSPFHDYRFCVPPGHPLAKAKRHHSAWIRVSREQGFLDGCLLGIGKDHVAMTIVEEAGGAIVPCILGDNFSRGVVMKYALTAFFMMPRNMPSSALFGLVKGMTFGVMVGANVVGSSGVMSRDFRAYEIHGMVADPRVVPTDRPQRADLV